jgi:hypothetical protein
MAALALVTWVVDADACVLVKPEPMSDPEPNLKRKQGGWPPGVSGYPGISWDKRTMKWQAAFRDNGKLVATRSFDIKDEAINAIEMYYLEKTVPLARKRLGVRKGLGVIYNKKGNKWTARVWNTEEQKCIALGSYEGKEDALYAIQKYKHEGIIPHPRRHRASRWEGLQWRMHGGKWRVFCKGKCVGTFKSDDEEGAARAYNVEAKRIGLTELNDVPDAPDVSKHDRFFKGSEKKQRYE